MTSKESESSKPVSQVCGSSKPVGKENGSKESENSKPVSKEPKKSKPVSQESKDPKTARKEGTPKPATKEPKKSKPGSQESKEPKKSEPDSQESKEPKPAGKENGLTRNRNGELSIKLEGLTIRGKSIGGFETCIMVDELSVAFDMGYQPDKVEAIQNIFITHGHPDHSGCLHFCHANRRQKHITLPWQIVMPAGYILPFKVMAAATSSMSRGGFPILFTDCLVLPSETKSDESQDLRKLILPFDKLMVDRLQEAETCKRIPLIQKPNYFVTAYKMNHKILSYGYVISEERKKLKKAYQGLDGMKLKALRDAGEEIQEILEIPTVAFTGDSRLDAILDCPDMLRSKILIMECTHFDDTVENATHHGHVHFAEFVEKIALFQNKWIILCHLSQKYRSLEDVTQYLNVLSEADRRRVIIWI